MAKYSYEFKKQVVEDYLLGKGGYTYLSKNMVSVIMAKCKFLDGLMLIKLLEMKG